MSCALVDAVLKHSPARGVDRLVLVALASFAHNGTVECWPALRPLARRAGLSPSTCVAAVRRLEMAGLVAVGRRHRRSNRYRIAPPRR